MIMVWGASSLIPYEALNIGLNIIGFIYVYTLITYYRWYMQPLSTKTALIIATACTLGSARVFAHFGLCPSPWR